MGYLFLCIAICSEITATLSLRASDGFSRLGWDVVVVLGYITAFACLTFALKHGLRLGVAYAIWAAIGVAAVALLSIPIYGESLSRVQVAGLGLVVLGVFALQVGASH